MDVSEEIDEYEALKSSVVNSGTMFHGTAVPVDEQTANESLSLPHPLRPAVLEVVRLRAALIAIDAALASRQTGADVEASINAMKDDILNGAGDAYDTLQELRNLMVADDATLQSAIDTLNVTASQNASAISQNTVAISQNASAISQNASAISQNTAAISQNETAISQNTTAIAQNASYIAQNISQPGDILVSFDTSAPAKHVFLNGATITNGAISYPSVAARYPWMVTGNNLRVPDLRGRFIRGWANGSSADPDRNSRSQHLRTDGLGGDRPGTYQADQYKSHTHSYSRANFATNRSPGDYSFAINSSNTSTGSSGGSETRPRNIAVSFWMRVL